MRKFYRVTVTTKEPLERPLNEDSKPDTLVWRGWHDSESWAIHETKEMLGSRGYNIGMIMSVQSADSDKGPFTTCPGYPRKY